jgi:hypothetical protein
VTNDNSSRYNPAVNNRPPILPYRSGEKGNPRWNGSDSKNQAGALVDSLWVVMKWMGRGLLEILLWW